MVGNGSLWYQKHYCYVLTADPGPFNNLAITLEQVALNINLSFEVHKLQVAAINPLPTNIYMRHGLSIRQ